jgi:hypothetical protein
MGRRKERSDIAVRWSTVLIIPAALREEGNAIAEAMGWGPDNYSVPLSATGQEPATHYGLHAYSNDQFKSWIEGTESLPEGMEAAQEVINALIYSFSNEIVNADHFGAVLAANTLKLVDTK